MNTMATEKTLFDYSQNLSTRAAVNTDCVAKLYITFPNGQTWQGTGFLYGNNVLATAGHCVYDPRYGGKATSVKAVFRNGTTETIPASRLYAPKEWLAGTVGTMPQLWMYDYGVMKLSGTPGRTLGFLDYLIASNSRLDQYISDRTEIHVVGYPANQTALKDYIGVVADYSANDVSITATFVSGQSGGPIILGGTDTFIAIGNYSADSSNPYNTGARITIAVADFLDLYY